MTTFVEKLAASGHLDGDGVERIGRNVSEFMKLAKADPSFHHEALKALGMDKEAGFGGAASSGFGHAVGTLAAGAGISLAGMAATDAYRAIKGSVMKGRNYKGMLDENPDLGAKRDAKKVQKAFSTLHKFNPEYASDPFVAGEFVRNTLDMDRVDIGTVNSLTQARKNITDAGRHNYSFDPGGLMQAGSSLMSPSGPEQRSAMISDVGNRARLLADSSGGGDITGTHRQQAMQSAKRDFPGFDK
jgi:hypothetical protein